MHTKWLITRSKVDMGWVHTNGTIELGFNGFNAPVSRANILSLVLIWDDVWFWRTAM